MLTSAASWYVAFVCGCCGHGKGLRVPIVVVARVRLTSDLWVVDLQAAALDQGFPELLKMWTRSVPAASTGRSFVHQAGARSPTPTSDAQQRPRVSCE